MCSNPSVKRGRFGKKEFLNILVVLFCAGFAAIYSAGQYTLLQEGTNFWTGENALAFLPRLNDLIVRDRFLIFFLLFTFLGLHFILDIEQMYNTLFRYRYLAAFLLLVVLVSLQIHGSSMVCMDTWLGQPAQGAYATPLFNEGRYIRSDEWAGILNFRLGSLMRENKWGSYNELFIPETGAPIAYGSVYAGWANLANVLQFLYPFMPGPGYSESLLWCGTIIFGFMASLEWCYLITGKNKLLGLTGACLITFSSFYQWWDFRPTWIFSAQAALALIWYFFEKKLFWHRCLIILGIASAGASFVQMMYPPWIVPAGYAVLVFLAWIIYQHWEDVRALTKKDYLIICMGILLSLSIIAAYLFDNAIYLSAISHTVYPGARFYSGGDYSFWNLYAENFTFQMSEFGNPSELSGMYTLFPLPMLLLSGIAIYRKKQNKKQNILQLMLLLLSGIYLSYLVVGWPRWLSRITMMGYATRTGDVFAWIQVLLLILAIQESVSLSLKKRGLATFSIVIITVGLLQYGVTESSWRLSQVFLASDWSTPAILVTSIAAWVVLSKNENAKKYFCIVLCICAMYSAALVHPVMRGVDAIYTHPVAQKIRSIAEKDRKSGWVTVDVGWPLSNFVRACGVPVFSGTQSYPNLEFWHTLDPQGKDEKIYNRFAYIAAAVTNEKTSMKLLQEDCFLINLNVRQMESMGIRYVYTQSSQPVLEQAGYKQIYSGPDGIIYHK